MKEFKEQYYLGRERMNPEIERSIINNTTPFSTIPAFPKYDKDGEEINFIELISYKRFLDCVKKVKHYTSLEDISGQQGFINLQQILMSTVKQIQEIEAIHIERLEEIATNVVKSEMEIPENAFIFDVKMNKLGTLKKDSFNNESETPDVSNIEESFGSVELFELEQNKRRFINSLIHGSAKKGHYMFELVRNEISELDARLPDLYGKLMSINDVTYWLMSDSTIDAIGKSSSGVQGLEEIDDTTTPTTIKARGVFQPVLVHELIKGIMEVFGTQGLPDDPKSQQMILSTVDTISNETWDIRLGVVCWEHFTKMYPVDVFMEGSRHLQHYLFARYCALDTEEFFEETKNVLSGGKNGEKFINNLLLDINRDLKESAFNEALGSDDYDYENEDEDEFFSKGGLADSDDKIGYINRRILNLENLKSAVNDSEKKDIQLKIDKLKKEIYDIQNPTEEIKKRKPFLFFKKGGKTDEYDVYDNKKMLESQVNEIDHHQDELEEILPKIDKVPSWVISKMERSTTDLSDITHYLDGEKKKNKEEQ